ncbi:LuxR family transcriptional regulator [Kitasatospora sp. A2-31]|uniref:LuxR family transcriptional regulator n=1 Tax=Kitasatospora sp. A2-31 TaxID=2916414 RepID=UPI001EEF0FB2|nr:LuxR family transcriptional regulator [Kitasatospora sp. A2-31]MCG6500142.1 LuxR family transcriptional regulator [Kitasatospora sp. A2-31]
MMKSSATAGFRPVVRDRPRDEIEQGLLEVQALLADTMVRHRDWVSKGSTVTVLRSGEDQLSAEVTRMIGRAGRGLEVVLSSDRARAEVVYRSLETLLSARGATVQVRLLCGQAGLDREFALAQLEAGHRVEVRTARLPPMEAILVDHQVALLADPIGGSRQAAVVRDASVLNSLHLLFASVWRGAVSIRDQEGFGNWARADFAGRVLGCLNAGMTDEVAARELSVSVRTYRRYVAEIMDMLRVNSRFQAGARAAELGLLPAEQESRPSRRTA